MTHIEPSVLGPKKLLISSQDAPRDPQAAPRRLPRCSDEVPRDPQDALQRPLRPPRSSQDVIQGFQKNMFQGIRPFLCHPVLFLCRPWPERAPTSSQKPNETSKRHPRGFPEPPPRPPWTPKSPPRRPKDLQGASLTSPKDPRKPTKKHGFGTVSKSWPLSRPSCALPWSSLAPRSSQEAPKRLPRRPRRRHRGTQEASQMLEEAPKRLPRRPKQTPTGNPEAPQRPRRGPHRLLLC